jgi:hypothetical protein
VYEGDARVRRLSGEEYAEVLSHGICPECKMRICSEFVDGGANSLTLTEKVVAL